MSDLATLGKQGMANPGRQSGHTVHNGPREKSMSKSFYAYEKSGELIYDISKFTITDEGMHSNTFVASCETEPEARELMAILIAADSLIGGQVFYGWERAQGDGPDEMVTINRYTLDPKTRQVKIEYLDEAKSEFGAKAICESMAAVHKADLVKEPVAV